MTPVAALWTSTSSGPSAATSLEHALRGDVAADEHRLGAERAELVGGLLGGAVVAQVADRDALRAVAREPQRDRAADPARAARDEDGHERGGSGRSAGAGDGISSQPGRVRRLARPFVGLRRGVAEAVEPLHLLLGVAAHLVVRAAALRRAREPERGAGRRSAGSRDRRARRRRRGSARPCRARSLSIGSKGAPSPAPVDLMLLGTVLLWALNITVTKYVLEHGFQPLAYADDPLLRRDCALLGLHLLARALVPHRPVATQLVALAALLIFVNQIGFVYALDTSSASTVGADPRHDADLHRDIVTLSASSASAARFWVAALVLVHRRRLRRVRRAAAFSGKTARRPARALHRRDVGAATRSRSRR